MASPWVVQRLLSPYRVILAGANWGTGQKPGQNYCDFRLQKQTVKITLMALEWPGMGPVTFIYVVIGLLKPFRANPAKAK